MSYPPPPGPKSNSSTPQPHPSLPARPPPPVQAPAFSKFSNSGANGKNQGAGGYGAFTGFKPRSVAGASSQGWQPQPATASAGPQPPAAYSAAQTGYMGGAYPATAYPQQTPYYPQASNDPYANPTPPQIRNPFPLPGQAPSGGYGSNSAYDPEYEAQVAQWQSAYAGKDDSNAKATGRGRAETGNANNTPLGAKPNVSAPISNTEMQSAVNSDTGVAAVVAGADGKQKTVVRSGGGQTWQDPSLLEWDPSHFRLFVGNLAGEVTDESLHKAFSRFQSIQKARVIRDKRTTKSKGYGFVSFSNGDDYFQAAKEMQGKYIGSHPVLVKRSTTEIKAVTPHDKRKNNKNNKNNKGGNGGGGHANTGAGVQKKPSKTKGGLKILG
ncbi:uncharacterized protein K452DRAFT_289324 [Aplosporella prunicola CBS 121167]|uniref:RRM domain-containing protein n=1 Tax=Aplosporella prunicola CBS 121167 TaxID=1176127 RepID=A0A6A6B9G1_9PEZI|nr:uncharacterized protein K452DRAFT_289324 [Aplosporella prunicola CBS 121167]KAF2139945.1 hypothetical protein K452DRAFT_289324 [Aplosporella prunicola CBS 121167]